MLVLDVAAQRIAHDLALCLSGRAGKRFCLGGQLVRDRYREKTGHMKSSYRKREAKVCLFLSQSSSRPRTSEGLS